MNLLIMMIFFSVILVSVGGGKSFLPLCLSVFWFAGEVSQVHPDVLPVLQLADAADGQMLTGRVRLSAKSVFPGGGHALPDAVGDAGVKHSD